MMNKALQPSSRCGYIAIIGRPNVGKSTLINQILDAKISITSKKPQTTRHRILGIKTQAEAQAIFVDTPGLHLRPKHLINRLLIRAANRAISDVDLIVFLIDARKWTEEDEFILKKLTKQTYPVILGLNKVDQVKDKSLLLPSLEALKDKMDFTGIVPLSALSGENVSTLEKLIWQRLPENPHFFPDDQITDQNERFHTAELIREKLMRFLGAEVPHSLTIEIEEFKQKNKVLHISALIWVERKGQKKIVVGNQGEVLKNVGKLARLDLEAMLETKVFLRLWVKVKSGWTDDLRALTQFGYGGRD